jgi:hypothetical protein
MVPAMDVWQLLQAGNWIALCVIILVVLIRGGTPERVGIALIVIGSVLSALFASDLGLRFRRIETSIFEIDLVMLIAFLALALASNRFWPIWTASFQAITVLTHFAVAVLPNSVPKGYSVLQGFWVFPMFGAILIGTYGYQKARRIAGA